MKRFFYFNSEKYLLGKRFSKIHLAALVCVDFIFCFFVRKRVFNKRPFFKKIIILKLDHLGDFLIATPFFKFLRAFFPKAEIVLFHNEATMELIKAYKRNSWFDKTFCYTPAILNRSSNLFFIKIYEEIKGFIFFYDYLKKDNNTLVFDLRPFSSFIFPIYPFLPNLFWMGFGLRGFSRFLSKRFYFTKNLSVGQSFLNALEVFSEKKISYLKPCLPYIGARMRKRNLTISRPYIVLQFKSASLMRDVSFERWGKILTVLNNSFSFLVFEKSLGAFSDFLKTFDFNFIFDKESLSINNTLRKVFHSSGVISVDSFLAHAGIACNKKTLVLMNASQSNPASYPRHNKNLFLSYKETNYCSYANFFKIQSFSFLQDSLTRSRDIFSKSSISNNLFFSTSISRYISEDYFINLMQVWKKITSFSPKFSLFVFGFPDKGLLKSLAQRKLQNLSGITFCGSPPQIEVDIYLKNSLAYISNHEYFFSDRYLVNSFLKRIFVFSASRDTSFLRFSPHFFSFNPIKPDSLFLKMVFFLKSRNLLI